MVSSSIHHGRNVAFGLGTVAYCTGLGLTIADAYYLGTTTDCNNDATCLKERIAGIAMTAIRVTAFVGFTAFLCCYKCLTALDGRPITITFSPY